MYADPWAAESVTSPNAPRDPGRRRAGGKYSSFPIYKMRDAMYADPWAAEPWANEPATNALRDLGSRSSGGKCSSFQNYEIDA